MQWTRDVLRLVLPNGVTALVQRETSAPVVAAVTHVRAGYFDEPDEWSGIAHVLEHMYFKGTARRGPGVIARETQEVGGYINAGTIYDKTVYYTVLPSAAGGVERALDVQADALMRAALDADELGRELEVIIQEANRKLDDPSAVTAETLYELLFDRHRMRRWRIGSADNLRRLTADDVRAYYESRYTPGRVVIAVVGDVDPDHVLGLIDASFGPWSRSTQEVPPSPAEPDRRQARARTLRGDVERPLASIGWRTVGTLHEDAPALDIAATMLGSGRGSRLYRALQVPGIAASSGAFHYTPTEVGVFELDLEAEGDHIEDAILRAVDLVEGLGEDGPGADEVRRARSLVATGWARRLESMDGRATALCEAEALGGYELLDEMAARLLRVSSAEVRDAVRRWLGRDSLNGVIYLPKATADLGLAAAWPPPSAGTAVAKSALPTLRPLGDAPAVPTPSVLPEGLRHWACPGLDLLIRPKPGSQVVTLLLHFPGVPLREELHTAGVSWLLARAAIRGAGGLRGEELALAAEMLGGAIVPSVSSDSIGWSITVAPQGLAHAAALLRSVAIDAELEDAAVTVERGLQISDARRVRDDMFRYPLQRALGVAFRGHPYGLPGLGDPKTLAAIAGDEVRAWAQHLAGTRPVAVVVGDVGFDTALQALQPLIGWDGPVGSSGTVSLAGWKSATQSEDRDKQQTALALAFPAPAASSPDRFPVGVIGALLSGLAGRLFDELRERRSLAYTVAAMPWLAREAGAMLCYIATSPEREDEARTAMLAELQRLSEEPPTPEELHRARSYAAGVAEIGRQSGRSVAGTILEAWHRGAIEDWASGPERLRAVELDHVLRVAADVFRVDRVAEYVVRGAGAS
jgi:zinc protease